MTQGMPEGAARRFNRDLSWLRFNERVLAQTEEERFPLLERVKFCAIFSSNLDEFFMKRVGLAKRRLGGALGGSGEGGAPPKWTLRSPWWHLRS